MVHGAKQNEDDSSTVSDRNQNVLTSFFEAFVSLPFPILIVDNRNTVVFGNQVAFALLASSEADVLESDLGVHLRPESGNIADLVISHAEDNTHFDSIVSSTGEAVRVDPRMLRIDGLVSLAVCYLQIATPTLMREQIVAEISNELISIKPLATVLTQVTRLLVDKARVDHVTLTLLDNSKKYFVFEAEYPPLSNPSIVGQSIPVQGMPTQESLLMDRNPLVITDVANHAISHESEIVDQFVFQLGVKSEVIVPLVFKDRVIGTIGIDALERRTVFSEEDLSMYVTIANQVAIAIENARLLEADETLRRIYREAETGKSLQETAGHWMSRLEGLLTYKSASMQMIVGSSRTILYSHGFERSEASPDLLPRLDHDELVRSTIENGDVTIIADTDQSALWGRHNGTSQVKSWIGIPLNCADGIKGIVTLDHDSPGFFGKLTERQIDRLRSFATAASSELRDAFLFHAGGRHIRAFTLISNVAELVGTKLGADDLLWCFAKETAIGLGGDFCCVFLQVTKVSGSYLKPRAYWPRVEDSKPTCIHLTSQSDNDDPVVKCYWESVTSQSCGTAEGTCESLPWPCESLILQPIVVSGRCIGVVVVGAGARNAFRESDEILLGTAGRLVANALEREVGIEKLQAIGNTRAGAENLDEVLRAILLTAKELTQKDDGAIFLLNETCSEVVHQVSITTQHPEPRLNNPNSVSAKLVSDTPDGILDIPDVKIDSRVRAEVRESFASMVAARICADSTTIGLLFLVGQENRVLTPNQRSFLQRLATQAAITLERVRLTDQLRDAEAMYHSLVDNVPVCVYQKDRNSIFLSANRGFCKSVSMSMQEVRGCTDFDFYPTEIAEKYVEDDRKVLAGETLTQDEMHVRPSDGRRIWVRVHKTPVLDGDGVIVGTQGMFWDVDEEKNSAIREKAISAQYELLVKKSPNGILVVSDGLISLANEASAQLLGFDSTDTMVNASLLQILQSAGVSTASEALLRLESKGEVEITLHPKGSEYRRSMAVKSLPLHGKMGDMQIVFSDVTEMNQLVKDINHRVKNNLFSISSLMYLQKERFVDNEVKLALQEAIDRVETIAEIHEELLQGQGAASGIQTADLASLISRLVNRLVPLYGVDASRVTKNLQPIRLDVDIACVCAMVASELVVNAFKHGHRQGEAGIDVKVLLERAGSSVRMRVADTGCGIGNAERSLGLKLVFFYVEKRLKGTCVFDRSESRGTCVTIEFPQSTGPDVVSFKSE